MAWIKNLANIEDLVLPKKENGTLYFNSLDYYERVCYKLRNDNLVEYNKYQFILFNTIKRYIGKPYDKAFRNYCKLVPIYRQKDFIEEFRNPVYHIATYDWNDYIIDDKGLIQCNQNRYIPYNGGKFKGQNALHKQKIHKYNKNKKEEL